MGTQCEEFTPCFGIVLQDYQFHQLVLQFLANSKVIRICYQIKLCIGGFIANRKVVLLVVDRWYSDIDLLELSASSPLD